MNRPLVAAGLTASTIISASVGHVGAYGWKEQYRDHLQRRDTDPDHDEHEPGPGCQLQRHVRRERQYGLDVMLWVGQQFENDDYGG